MFLTKLNHQEKEAFLELAHHVAYCDEGFSEVEQKIIGGYCREMLILDIRYEENDFNLDNTLAKFESKKSQKIALLEILALIYSDEHVMHDEEVKIINHMLDKFAISTDLLDVFIAWSKSIIALTNQGKSLILL